ncbi:MAG: hypothetical protein ACFHHU_04530 [Porticoccaceae bacterium]
MIEQAQRQRLTYDQDSALALMGSIVAHKEYEAVIDDLDISYLGIVSGFLDINEEIEIVIRFPSYLEQATKREFEKRYFILPDVDSEVN